MDDTSTERDGVREKRKGEQPKGENKKKRQNRWTDIISSPRELTTTQ